MSTINVIFIDLIMADGLSVSMKLAIVAHSDSGMMVCGTILLKFGSYNKQIRRTIFTFCPIENRVKIILKITK